MAVQMFQKMRIKYTDVTNINVFACHCLASHESNCCLASSFYFIPRS